MSATDWFVAGCALVVAVLNGLQWRRNRHEHREAMARIDRLGK